MSVPRRSLYQAYADPRTTPYNRDGDAWLREQLSEEVPLPSSNPSTTSEHRPALSPGLYVNPLSDGWGEGSDPTYPTNPTPILGE